MLNVQVCFYHLSSNNLLNLQQSVYYKYCFTESSSLYSRRRQECSLITKSVVSALLTFVAFHTDNHNILIARFSWIGVYVSVVDLHKSYVTFMFSYHVKMTFPCILSRDVLQGSVLGHVHYVHYYFYLLFKNHHHYTDYI